MKDTYQHFGLYLFWVLPLDEVVWIILIWRLVFFFYFVELPHFRSYFGMDSVIVANRNVGHRYTCGMHQNQSHAATAHFSINMDLCQDLYHSLGFQNVKLFLPNSDHKHNFKACEGTMTRCLFLKTMTLWQYVMWCVLLKKLRYIFLALRKLRIYCFNQCMKLKMCFGVKVTDNGRASQKYETQIVINLKVLYETFITSLLLMTLLLSLAFQS